MIQGFYDRGTQDVFNGVDSKAARKACPQNIWSVAKRKLDMLDAAVSLESLRVPSGNRLEPLKEDRKGQHAIRVNDQYRLCFIWTEAGPKRVEVTDYH